MRLLLAICLCAAAVRAAEVTVNVVPAPIAILPVTTKAIAVQGVNLGTNGPIGLILNTGAVDYIGIVSSITGSLVTESQRARYLGLMTNYMSESHIMPQPLPTGTNLAAWRMSSSAIELWQLVERLAMKEVQLALIAPPGGTNAPITNGPPIIILPGPQTPP